MKKKILRIGTVALLAMASSAWAADIFGNWIARIPDALSTSEAFLPPLGETVFYFRADGTRLTGTVSDSHGKTAISEGKINDDEISFVVTRSLGKKEIRLLYRGKVSLNEIHFTRETRDGTGQQFEFVARREFQRNQDIPLRSINAPETVTPPKRVVPEEPPPHK
jgi:hypothetical protein